MKFVTADTHFFDPAMIEHPHFAPRRADFLTVGDMDQAIIDAWNHTVTDQDVVYHCGDIAVYYKTASPKQLLDLLDHLKVQIIFVKGNHDSRDLFKYLEKIIIRFLPIIRIRNFLFMTLAPILNMIITSFF
ncbi:hypothetical protein Q757_04165 [Oenococcus alcoholitolerans]|uniref:Calcineurin-like phosphoesterase domain-containing protein n=1 Tax=Oenococcus alcoholitolerans TaxID=931074 RepID=A0ABR4XR00_9LACO|nr:hypothetical protein Q757_04165 [Oenococcus alcoholitolerans]